MRSCAASKTDTVSALMDHFPLRPRHPTCRGLYLERESVRAPISRVFSRSTATFSFLGYAFVSRGGESGEHLQRCLDLRSAPGLAQSSFVRFLGLLGLFERATSFARAGNICYGLLLLATVFQTPSISGTWLSGRALP